MNAPPRTAELLLESLGAGASFGEPLLGDMAEEFTDRVERDGQGAARRWYYGEAIRVTPHLLRVWGRGLRPGDMRRLASLIFAAYFFTLMLTFLVMMVTQSVGGTLGLTPAVSFNHGSPADALSLAFAVAGGVVCSLTGGYIAAWLDDRAPLASAVALGVVWSIWGFVGAAITMARGEHGWYLAFMSIVALVGPILGGILRVRGARSSIQRTEPTS